MLSRRNLEMATGFLTGAFGVAVMVQSVELGSGWSAEGIESGTFPLLAGLLIVAASLVNIGLGLLGPNPVLATGPELKRLAGLFVPAVLFIAAIPFLGIYLATAVYLPLVLTVQHRLALWRSGLIALTTVLILYWLFERIFQVPLPQGWLGSVLGF